MDEVMILLTGFVCMCWAFFAGLLFGREQGRTEEQNRVEEYADRRDEILRDLHLVKIEIESGPTDEEIDRHFSN